MSRTLRRINFYLYAKVLLENNSSIWCRCIEMQVMSLQGEMGKCENCLAAPATHRLCYELSPEYKEELHLLGEVHFLLVNPESLQKAGCPWLCVCVLRAGWQNKQAKCTTIPSLGACNIT